MCDRKVLICAPGVGLREFGFGRVYSQNTSQRDIFDEAARPLLCDFINGTNVAIMCFGQTGSGKTFTMFGSDEVSATSLGADCARHDVDEEKMCRTAGLVPRAMAELMGAVESRKRQGVEMTLRCSYVEVYGDDITDLLEAKPVGAWRGVASKAVAQGLAAVTISTKDEMQQLLRRGEANKRRAATAMNDRSTRAHALLIVDAEQLHVVTGLQARSQLCLADLGGSEQVFKSEVAEMRARVGGFMEQAETMREAVQINLGLLALKNCINALHNNLAHTPYQDSKLTMLLQGALGGNCKTLVVVTASPAAADTTETLQSLRFGEQCAKVENVARATRLVLADALEEIDRQIRETEALIRLKERWETRRVVRRDERHGLDGAEATCGEETVITTVPVGAELEQVRLSMLLERRRALLGADA